MSVFNILKDSDHFGQSETKNLRSIFGAFPATSGTKVCHIISTIKQITPSEKIDQALRNKTVKEQKDEIKEFGDGIVFHLQEKRKLQVIELWSSDSEEENSSKVDDFLKLKHKNSSVKDSKSEQSHSIKHSWLIEECEKHTSSSKGGLCTEDLFSALFDMLSSERTSEEIQNDLLELLGFDAIELITRLLKERFNIVNAIIDGEKGSGKKR